MTTVIAGGLFNTANATCGMLCTYCNGYNNFLFVPAPINDPIGTSTSVVTHATDSYGNDQTFSGGSWTTTDSSVMTVNNGNTTGVSVGQVTIQNFLPNIIVFQGNFCVSDNMNDSCPQANVTPSAPGNVTPNVTVTLKFTGNKSGGDNLSFLKSGVDCSESLGAKDCTSGTSATGYWLWNLEGTGVVTDDASNWTVAVSLQHHYSGYYRDSNKGLVTERTLRHRLWQLFCPGKRPSPKVGLPCSRNRSSGFWHLFLSPFSPFGFNCITRVLMQLGSLVEVGNPSPPENCEFVQPLVLHISAKHELRLNQEPIARDHLSARLGLILKERIRPRLYVDADSEITMQEFAQILDLVRDSGDKTEIRLITQGNRKYSCVDVPSRPAA